MTLDSPSSPPSLLWCFESEFLRPYRGAILLGLLGLFVQSVLLLPIPLLQGWVVDHLVAYFRAEQTAGSPGTIQVPRSPAGEGPPISRRSLVPPRPRSPGRFSWRSPRRSLLHLVRAAVAWKVAAMMGRISQEVVVALRGALHRKLMRLPMAYFDAQQTGRLMARVTSDVGSILMFIRSGILQLLNDLILSAGHRRLARLAPVAAGPGGRGDRAALRPQPALLLRQTCAAFPTRSARKCPRFMPF